MARLFRSRQRLSRRVCARCSRASFQSLSGRRWRRNARTVYRTAAPAQERVVTRESGRSWKKTAMVIGGSTAGGAGVGAIVGGKKGALIGAALGGGAASIYEATKR